MEFYKIFKNFGRVNSEYWNRVNLEFELGLIQISFFKGQVNIKFYLNQTGVDIVKRKLSRDKLTLDFELTTDFDLNFGLWTLT